MKFLIALVPLVILVADVSQGQNGETPSELDRCGSEYTETSITGWIPESGR